MTIAEGDIYSIIMLLSNARGYFARRSPCSAGISAENIVNCCQSMAHSTSIFRSVLDSVSSDTLKQSKSFNTDLILAGTSSDSSTNILLLCQLVPVMCFILVVRYCPISHTFGRSCPSRAAHPNGHSTRVLLGCPLIFATLDYAS